MYQTLIIFCNRTARRALEVKQASFILDTYVEALFVNDFKKEALDAAKRALALASEKRAYYRDQVVRFENRL
ncbi:MAG: hypothetical protein HUN05_13715 [Desulfobacter sp.]|nr:MAG: hypothetical protein HUN05_13715 [Desulfobacter sp.]